MNTHFPLYYMAVDNFDNVWGVGNTLRVFPTVLYGYRWFATLFVVQYITRSVSVKISAWPIDTHINTTKNYLFNIPCSIVFDEYDPTTEHAHTYSTDHDIACYILECNTSAVLMDIDVLQHICNIIFRTSTRRQISCIEYTNMCIVMLASIDFRFH